MKTRLLQYLDHLIGRLLFDGRVRARCKDSRFRQSLVGWARGVIHRFNALPPRQPHSPMDYLFLKIMLWGQERGYVCFNLGMAPLAGLQNRSFAPLWNRFGALVFRWGEKFYNFCGQHQYKNKFDPCWEPRYIAAPNGLIMLPRSMADITALRRAV